MAGSTQKIYHISLFDNTAPQNFLYFKSSCAFRNQAFSRKFTILCTMQDDGLPITNIPTLVYVWSDMFSSSDRGNIQLSDTQNGVTDLDSFTHITVPLVVYTINTVRGLYYLKGEFEMPIDMEGSKQAQNVVGYNRDKPLTHWMLVKQNIFSGLNATNVPPSGANVNHSDGYGVDAKELTILIEDVCESMSDDKYQPRLPAVQNIVPYSNK